MKLTREMEWAEGMNCAVTVCDRDGVIVYMNDKARQTYAAYGDLMGHNIITCHNERSRAIIERILETGESNSYTITKGGQRKMIYQTPWRENGQVAGIVEISMVIPDMLPHYNRDQDI